MKRLLYLLSACLMTFGFSACNDDDDNLKLQDISVEFAVSEAGMDGETVSLGLKLSRATTESLDVTMEMTSSDVSDADITTTPAMTDGKITVNIPAGQSTGTFTVAKATGKNPEGTAKFQILSLSLTEGYKIGTTKEMTLSFTPIVSTGGTMTLEGKVGDQNYANMVYVDLSNNSQIQIDRKSWNLGFYCGDEFRVVLNSSYATVAAASEKTDFAAVTLEDAQSAPNIAAGSMSEDFKAEWIDDVTGDLSKTAFGEISATDANNKVFFVASADNKTNTDGTENRSLWYKVKVTRSGNGYKVEYGKVEDTTPKTVEITKDPIYSFIGLSLETGEQVLQPAKSKWDIMWAYAASSTMMASGPVISFTQDVITINNLGGAETAIVMTDTKSYADFKLADVASAEFQTEANTIGTDWRTPAMPGVENPGVKADRFFVIKDCAENYYKLRFLKFGSGDDGERGRPQLEYELLK